MARVKQQWDREADKFEELPTGANANTNDFPERTRGTTTAVKTISSGYELAPDGTIIPSADAKVDALVTEDSGTAGTYYVGKAVIGSATSAAVWQIKRIQVIDTPPIDVDIGWADSDPSFDNIWDNREALVYSQ